MDSYKFQDGSENWSPRASDLSIVPIVHNFHNNPNQRGQKTPKAENSSTWGEGTARQLHGDSDSWTLARVPPLPSANPIHVHVS